MKQYTFEYQCYCDGRFAWYVLVTSTRSNRSVLVWANSEGSVYPANIYSEAYKATLIYPVAFGLIPPAVRGAIRAYSQREVDRYIIAGDASCK